MPTHEAFLNENCRNGALRATSVRV